MTKIETNFDLEPFCPECPVLEPKVEVKEIFGDNKIIHRTLMISCEKIEQCRRIRDYIKAAEDKTKEKPGYKATMSYSQDKIFITDAEDYIVGQITVKDFDDPNLNSLIHETIKNIEREREERIKNNE